MSAFDEVFEETTEQVSPRLSAFDKAFAEITPETVQESLKKPTGTLDKPRVSFMHESVGGIRDVIEGAKELGRGYPLSLGKIGGGALRFLGAPTAPALDWLGRTAGTSLQDLLQRVGVGGAVGAGASAAADALAQGVGIRTGQAALGAPVTLARALRRLMPSYAKRATAIQQLGAVAERSKAGAISAREQAALPTLEAEALEAQLPGGKEAARRAAIEAKSTPVTTAAFPEAGELTRAAPGPALARKAETGEFFGGAVARERQKAQSVFKQGYGEVRAETAGIEYATDDIVTTAQGILDEAGLGRKILPTKGEAIAGKTKGELLPKGAEAAIDEAEAIGRRVALPDSTLEGIVDSLVAGSKTATFNDLAVLRSRTRGAIRGFKAKGDLDTARRLEPLEAAYTETIEGGLAESTAGKLRALDELYGKEFIPKFGFESPASKLTGVASEDVITKLFPTKGQVEGVTKPAMTKTAVGAPEWERLSSTFWQQKILEPAMEGKSLNFATVQKNMARYAPETLREAAGYKEFKTVIDKFSEAEQLTAKQIAEWQLKTGVKAETARGRFATLERALAGKREQISALATEQKTAEESLKFAQKSFEELTKQNNGLTHAVLRDFTGKARWVGAAGILYPAMRTALTMPQFVTGVGIMFTGEQLFRLLGSPAGRSSLSRLVQSTGRAGSAFTEAQKIGVIYRGLVGAKPTEEGQP